MYSKRLLMKHENQSLSISVITSMLYHLLGLIQQYIYATFNRMTELLDTSGQTDNRFYDLIISH